MLFKLSTLALVALLGVQAHAHLTAADIVKDIENINEVYIDAIDYLASHSPDNADFNSRMDGFSDRLMDACKDTIADSQNVHLSVSDQASIDKAMIQLDLEQLLYNDRLKAIQEIDLTPSAECIATMKAFYKIDF